ncbi:MAG: 50S ribosomal protein L3 N(5)-glutamine methyltransferase [Alphaproteobacteria bacterium]|nr:50S ribosomal protein L3 N(5)-glutamine methyltransferase [Alphaproteobacteria bacterium]
MPPKKTKTARKPAAKKTAKKPAKKPVKKPVVKTPAAKSLPSLKLPPAQAARELSTVRDFVRYAVSRFMRADLFFGHGTFTPFDEAVFLVLEALRLPIDQLEPYLDARLLPEEKKLLADLIDKRVKTRKPTAYLLHKTYLQGYPFYVDERVIVPRSYIAELLFSDVLGQAGYALIENPYGVESVLDLCTGSGCLAILAAELFPNAEVDAVDLSPAALEVAKINVEACPHSDRITLYEGDLFAPVKGKRYDFIITNPPYVDAELMTDMPREYLYEPRMALESGADGLDAVRQILDEAADHLNPGGRIICEIGYGRELLEEEYPGIAFLWLDTESSEGEVFWLTDDQLAVRT